MALAGREGARAPRRSRPSPPRSTASRATCCWSSPTAPRSPRSRSARCGSTSPPASAWCPRAVTTSSGSSTSRCSSRPTTALDGDAPPVHGADRRPRRRPRRDHVARLRPRARRLGDRRRLDPHQHDRRAAARSSGSSASASEEAQSRFGFLLDAFRYGAPPHGGIAMGVDRIVTLLAGRDSIRDVIAFPKAASGSDPLTGAPAPVDEPAAEEVGLRVAVFRAAGGPAAGLSRRPRSPRGPTRRASAAQAARAATRARSADSGVTSAIALPRRPIATSVPRISARSRVRSSVHTSAAIRNGGAIFRRGRRTARGWRPRPRTRSAAAGRTGSHRRGTPGGDRARLTSKWIIDHRGAIVENVS